MSNYLALRSSAAPTITVSTLLGSTIAVRSIFLQSTTISLGQSTNQTYNNFSNGSFTTGWASTLTGAISIREVVLSPNGAVQTILQNSGSTINTTITSLNSGLTWTGSTMRGLPTSGALPYQTYGSTINAMTVPSITAVAAAPSGTNQLAIASNDLVYTSANSGATFSPTGLGQNNSPFIYIPFDGSVTDVMGNATYASGSSTAPVYTTTLNKVGTQALSLVNTPSQSGNATNYQRWNWTGSANFTVSFWFNAQTPAVANSFQYIFTAYSGLFVVYLTPGGALYLTIPSGGSYIAAAGGTGIATLIAANTWYNVVATFQTNGQCSLYLNNTFIGSSANVGGAGPTSFFSLGTFDVAITAPFNGFIDDFRIYNYAVTNPSGAALINPLVGPIMPFIYLTFDGSTTTDVMGNSTTTATGSPGYVAGQVGATALNLVNTAGTTATRYVTGPWTGATNFTISLWLNYQTAPASTTQVAMSLRSSGNPLVDIGHNPSGGFVQFYYGASNVQFMSLGTLSINTWYRITFVYQQGGTSSAYLNEQLISSVANSPTIYLSPTTFELGSRLTGTLAYNGYIDDFRIYNGAFTPSQLSHVLYSPSHAVGSPNIYLPFENGSVLDVMGYSAVSARGIMNFVPGVVGSTALNLVNPAGGTPVNYIRGSWAGSPNSTVSLWFNLQSLGSATQTIFGAYQSWLWIAVTSTGVLGVAIPTGGAAGGSSFSMGTVNISLNTWYHVVLIFQTNALCSFYVNGSLIGTFTNVGGTGTLPSTQFSLGSYDFAVTSAFNGYIDDFKLYNCAVPFHMLGPMNYTQAALSNTGAYQVVTAANGGVYVSANSGSSWSQVGSAALAVISEVDTIGGQLITPQLTGLAANTWTQNGVNWVASASSVLSVLYAYGAFNNYVGSAGTYSWGSGSGTYSTSSPFACISAVSTTILGIGATVGEWLQIQTSVPLVMQSYSYTCGGAVNIPQRYYIVGSNDGSAWYPIQLAVMTTNPFTGNFQVASTYITVNQSGIQTIIGGQTGSGSFTTYPTTTNAYTYFRILATNVFGAGSLFEFGELYINFATPPTPLYVAPSAALIANQSLSAITVMPQQTGLASNTWTQNGISWVASGIFLNNNYLPYYGFNNSLGPNSWASSSLAYTTTPLTTGTATTISGVGTVYGDYLQLQSSVPLIMNSYQFATGSDATIYFVKTFYIVGSNDGSTWLPIQYGNANSTQPTTVTATLIQNVITVNLASAQIFGNSILTTATYSTTTNAFTYFRLIPTATFNSTGNVVQIGEWLVNFTAYTPALLQSLTMSPTGAHMALTGAGATAPNLTGLTTNTWTTNGVSWTASASSFATTGYEPYRVYNNAYSGGSNGWGSIATYNTSTGLYTGPVSTTIIGVNGGNPVLGEWIQIQSSIPLILQSYTYASYDTAPQFAKTYYIVGSNDNSTWYPLQYVAYTTNPFTAATTILSSYITVNNTGSITVGAGSGTSLPYSTSTSSYLYFRMIITSIWASNIYGNLSIGELYLNFQSGPTFYSTDYGSNWTRALSAATLPNANVLATSGNGQYSIQASGQTVTLVSNTFAGYSTGNHTIPTFTPALSSAVSNAAINGTGQYMVLVTQGTSNNVYYSTNYGVSFTGLTLGSSPMVSCAMSADGTYVTIASATQVFTLNWNTRGFAVTLGNSAGTVNQAQNAIAIGNQAGVTNQSANSIILNGSGSVVNAYVPGFFVAPVASAGSSVSGSFAILGYGSDSQVVQTGLTMLSNGFVGIGTNNPGAPFYLFTASTGLANGIMSVFSSSILSSTSGSYDIIQRWYESSWNASFVDLMWVRQSTGVDWQTASLRFQAKTDATWQSFIEFNGTNNNYGVTIGAGASSSNPNSVPGVMYVKSGGNVGIGITNPVYPLSVQGHIQALNTTNDVMGLFSPSYGNFIHIGAWNAQGSTSKNIAMNYLGGNVGIGINAPTSSLHLNGLTGSGHWNNSCLRITNSITTADSVADGTSIQLQNGYNAYYFNIMTYGYASGAGSSFYIHSDNAVGVVLSRGSNTWSAYSDSRMKINKMPLSSELSNILRLNPVSYLYDSDPSENVNIVTRVGFLADEVFDIYPNLVTKDSGMPYTNKEGETFIPMTMCITDLIPYHTKAIQELAYKNDALEAKNAELTQKLDSLLAWAQAQGFS